MLPRAIGLSISRALLTAQGPLTTKVPLTSAIAHKSQVLLSSGSDLVDPPKVPMPRLSCFWFVNRTQRRRHLLRFRTKTFSHELSCFVTIFTNLKIFSCIINNAHGSIKYGRVQAKNSEAMHCLMFHLLRSMHRQLTEIRRQRSSCMQLWPQGVSIPFLVRNTAKT